MNCCANCFNSDYLKSIIEAKNEFGDCEFCNLISVPISTAAELINFIKDIFSLYTIDDNSSLDIIKSISKDFNLISKSVENPRSLFESIFVNHMEYYGNLFKPNTFTTIKRDLVSKGSLIHRIWEEFKKEIKTENRYHIQNTIDLKKLKEIFEHDSFNRLIDIGNIYYRCRISNKLGFDCDQMGNPPSDLATTGRANPEGISYLYVADRIETSIYETRASLFDYVTVGEFKTIESMKVLNLRDSIDDPVSWSEIEEMDDYIIYLPFVKSLKSELSLPIRKRDKVLDYIPTQYISEFIKSLKFDAIEYQSSLYSEGYNLVVFNTEKLKCTNTQVHKIKKIKLNHHKI